MKKFLNNMFSGKEDTSSKRVNGTMCILLVTIIVTLSIILDWTIRIPQENLLHTIFWGGTGLLGITTLEKYLKK